MNKIMIVFLGAIILHAIYNLINYLRYGYIENLFNGLFVSEAKVKIRSLSLKNVIVNYIKHAGVSDSHIPVSQAIGYGQVANANISVLDNIVCNRQDVFSAAYELLLEAKGNYWIRFINSFNPFYWIRMVLYIPKYLLSYLGLKTDSVVIKIFQLLYWLLGIVFTILVSVFPDEVKTFIMSFIHIN